MRLHPDVHMSSSEACRTADSRQIRRAALFLSVHVSPVSFSALFLLLHICTVSSIALFLLLHACPVSFSALFLLVHICTVSSIALFLSVHVFPVSFIALSSLLHICNDFFISILHCFLHSLFLHCVKPCIFARFSSTIAFLHFWNVAICAVFEGFYSCSFVMFFLQSCIRLFTELSFISFLQLLSMCFPSIKYPMIALSIINLTALFTSRNWLTHVGVMSKNCIVFILRKKVCFVLDWLAISHSAL